MHFLNYAMVRAIHTNLILRYGGSHGVRDRGLLESALARPLHLLHYQPQATAAQLAAVLGWGLIKNHAFVDGNKRIGLAAAVTFLRWNGYRLTSSEVEETAMVLRAAAGEIHEDEWTAWMERAVARISP